MSSTVINQIQTFVNRNTGPHFLYDDISLPFVRVCHCTYRQVEQSDRLGLLW